MPLKILHIEDNPYDVELVHNILRAEWNDCEITLVSKKNDLQSILEKDNYDLVLSDFKIPTFKNGFEVLELVKKSYDDKPIIIISGTIGEETAVDLMKEGATDYVSKDKLIRLVPAINRSLKEKEEREEKKKTQSALRESEEKFRQMADNIEEVFWLISKEQEILYINSAYEKVWGRSRKDLKGNTENFINAVYHKDMPAYLAEYEKYNKIGFFNLQYRIVRLDGEIRWVWVRTFPVRDSNGAIIRHAGVAVDITDLIEAKELAEQSNKMKDAFIANMSHEIRTPLTGILGLTKIIKEIFVADANQEDEALFEGIEKASQRLVRTVDMILNYSRFYAGEFPLDPKIINIAKICENLITEFYPQAKAKSIKLTFENRCKSTSLFLDEYTLTQALSNLIDNAIKYTEKGFVEIILYADKNDDVILSISDSGEGINKENVDKIFESYFQEEMGYGRAYEGVGLGLSLAKAFLSLNNAALSLKTKKGEGTTFTIRFGKPVFDEAANTVEKKTIDHKFKNKTILIVEDEAIVLLAVSRFLSDKYNLLTADNAEKVKELLKQNSVDLILMDISIKGTTNGLELTTELRANNEYSNIPVIAVTAHSSEKDKKNCLDAGCDDYISKPYSFENLIKKIETFI